MPSLPGGGGEGGKGMIELSASFSVSRMVQNVSFGSYGPHFGSYKTSYVLVYNALVICYHGPNPHPQGNERGLTKVLPRQCGGNTRGLLYICKTFEGP